MAHVLMPHDDARFIRQCNWPYDHGRWSRGYPYCFSVRWPHHIVDAIEGISAMHNCNGRRPGIRSTRDGRPYPPKIYFTHGRDRLLTISVYERLRKQNELNANDQKIRKKTPKGPLSIAPEGPDAGRPPQDDAFTALSAHNDASTCQVRVYKLRTPLANGRAPRCDISLFHSRGASAAA